MYIYRERERENAHEKIEQESIVTLQTMSQLTWMIKQVKGVSIFHHPW